MTSQCSGLKRTHRITKLRLGEVSFVDEGDNPGAEVLITKRRDVLDTEIIKGRLADLGELVGEIAELAAGSGGMEGVEKAATILGGVNMDIDQLNERLEQIETDLTNVTKAKDKAEADLAEANSALATANAEIEKLKAGTVDTDEDDILKGLPQPVRDRIEKAEKAAADALESVEKSRDEAELNANIEKVRALGVKDAEGLGGVLHRITKGKSTPEDGAKVVELLTIAKQVGDKGNALFEAIGVAKGKEAAATDADEAQGKLDEAIDAIMKAKPALTREQAYTEALDANPGLYDGISKRHPNLEGAE